MRSRILAMLAALVLTTPPALPRLANAGAIRGTLHVPPVSAQSAEGANAYPGHAHALPGAHAVTHGLVTDAVLYIERIDTATESSLAATSPPPPRLTQKDQMFTPRVVAIAAGSVVDFPNQDPIYHNVFSASPVRRFDLGKYPKGDSRRVDFRRPGLVNVYCDIHSNMEAFILVVPNHAFARPSTTGEFALPELPPGHYELHLWHPDLGSQTIPVDVPASGDAVESLSF